ncbi:MAG: excisionase family DNA-binding protein [Myxococcota bacterium]
MKLKDYKETSIYLGIPLGTLYAKVARRGIPHVRLGPRHVLFDWDELDRWIEEHRVPVQPN